MVQQLKTSTHTQLIWATPQTRVSTRPDILIGWKIKIGYEIK